MRLVKSCFWKNERMGSRGRRVVESRVGDEEMEEEKLYTKSKRQIQC
ncbi:MAG: hypothetical protein ACLSGK_10195 [Lachnospiraceae bacterium]